ncbi:MAG: 30S ribosomal protein S7 [Candidatus Jorgensenbacteria bacterium]|nr:30S ribosomal protein S7 [Candidatus Jorgensenbacteria bacterium]
MRKKGYYKKRDHDSDHKFTRVDIARFINYLMTGGKKTRAEFVFYGAMEKLQEVTKQDPVSIFEKAIENATPMLEVVSQRIGGANYQIPREIRPERKFFLATHWLIQAARGKKGKPMAEKLADEIIAASKNEGIAIKKKQDMHRMAEANRAFASLLRKPTVRQ